MFPKHAHWWFISGINLTWTYHAPDKLKVIIMGNSYDVRVVGRAVLETFLLAS